MFDTHAIARQLTGSGLTTEQAAAITDAVRQAAEQGDQVTPETLCAEIATVHGTIDKQRADIYRAMLLQAAAIVGALLAVLRLVS